MKKKILWVSPLVLGVILLCNLVVVFNNLSNETSSAESVQSSGYNLVATEGLLCANQIDSMAITEGIIELEEVAYGLTIEEYSLPKATTPSTEIIQLGEVNMITNHGIHITTDAVEVDVMSLMNTYTDSYESPDWDDRNKINIIATMWEFLVNQQGMHPINASALLGNIMVEGQFAEEQGSYDVIQDIEYLRAVLGKGKRGYGVVQWTYSTRQKSLMDYYDLAYELYPNDWDKVKIIAECAMLIEEVKAFEIFPDIYSAISLEDSTGRVCVLYESFENSSSAWSKSNGEYILISNEGSSDTRLEYAQNIYDYFME